MGVFPNTDPTEPTKADGFWSRLNHPIFGAFVTSWLLWNWEIGYLLIRGLPSPTDTIKVIGDTYFTTQRLPHLLWIPSSVATLFLLIGPPLKDIYEVYRNRLSAWIGGLSPVSKWQFDQVESQKKRLEQELEILQRAIRGNPTMVPDGHGQSITIEQMIRNNETWMRDMQSAQKERDQLAAENLVLKRQLEAKTP